MASGCCKVCGRYTEYLLIGDFCSDGCKSKFYSEQSKNYYAQKKAEQEKQEQIFRDKVKTAASVASAAMIAEQTAMMKETRRKEMAEEQARQQEEYQKQLEEEAELEEYCKQVGFKNADEAREWKKRYPDLDVDQLAEKKREELKEIQGDRDFHARMYKNYMDFYKNNANESDKELGAKLKKLAVKLGNTSEFWDLCILGILPLIVLISGLVFRKKFIYNLPPFLRLGGFSAFIFWLGFSLQIPRFIQGRRIKSAVRKIVRIKSKSDYPFFNLPSEWYKGRTEIYSITETISLVGLIVLLCVFPPKILTFIFHKSWIAGLSWTLEIVIGGLVLFIILGAGEFHEKSVQETHNSYFIKHHIFEKIGPFVGSEGNFDSWLKGQHSFYESYEDKNGKKEYACSFLPRHKDEKFIEKYAKCTKSKIYCVDQLYEKNQNKENTKKENFMAPADLYFLKKLDTDKKSYLTYQDVKKAIEHNFGSSHGEIGKLTGTNEELPWIKQREEKYGYVSKEEKERFYKVADKYREKAMKKIKNFESANVNKRGDIISDLNLLYDKYIWAKK